MATWFEGSGEIAVSIAQVKSDFGDIGTHFVGLVKQIPGMRHVELVEQGADFVTIDSDEGRMIRTSISLDIQADRVLVEYDEEFQGEEVTAKSHFRDEFTSSGKEVTHHTIMSGDEAPGSLDFFYRRFGSESMGKTFLKAYRKHFEKQFPRN